jgi:hypothetical protein
MEAITVAGRILRILVRVRCSEYRVPDLVYEKRIHVGTYKIG